MPLNRSVPYMLKKAEQEGKHLQKIEHNVYMHEEPIQFQADWFDSICECFQRKRWSHYRSTSYCKYSRKIAFRTWKRQTHTQINTMKCEMKRESIESTNEYSLIEYCSEKNAYNSIKRFLDVEKVLIETIFCCPLYWFLFCRKKNIRLRSLVFLINMH